MTSGSSHVDVNKPEGFIGAGVVASVAGRLLINFSKDITSLFRYNDTSDFMNALCKKYPTSTIVFGKTPNDPKSMYLQSYDLYSKDGFKNAIQKENIF